MLGFDEEKLQKGKFRQLPYKIAKIQRWNIS